MRTISAARDGGLWVATGTVDPLASRDLRLFKLKEGTWSAQLEPYPWPQDSQQFQRLALLEDESGRVWCAAAGSVFFRSPAGSWQRLLSAAPGVQVEVLCLAEDENGLLWMGTRTTGLLQVQKRQAMTLSLPAFARQHAVLTVCASKDGSVWCGTDGAGIFRWQADQITPFGSDQGLTNLHVATLLEDRRTNLWAGTDGGLFRRVGERFEPAPGPPALREPILALLEDRQGNLWTGGAPDWFGSTPRAESSLARKRVCSGEPFARWRKTANGRIWVGPNAGLYWLDGEEFQYYPVPQEPHLQGIFALHCDTAGSLWIGTDLAGLLRFRADHFDQWLWSRDGLPSNHLTAILEDDQGDLWISSENGIFGCSKPELDKYQRGLTPPLRPRRLTPAEGLAQKVCSGVGQPSACKSADGRLWFPNGPALVVFDPTTIPRTLRVWPPLIEGVSVDGVPASLVPAGLRIRSGARRIEFQYSFAQCAGAGAVALPFPTGRAGESVGRCRFPTRGLLLPTAARTVSIPSDGQRAGRCMAGGRARVAGGNPSALLGAAVLSIRRRVGPARQRGGCGLGLGTEPLTPALGTPGTPTRPGCRTPTHCPRHS